MDKDSMDERQKEILLNTLGLNHGGIGHRNHFYVGEECHDYANCELFRAIGLMVRGEPIVTHGHKYYYYQATASGVVLASTLIDVKPLFVPLKAGYYRKFVYGSKSYEYRLYGPRWNTQTVYHGRRVVLSCGYGKAQRMTGVIVFAEAFDDFDDPDFVACYGRDKKCMAFKIRLER